VKQLAGMDKPILVTFNIREFYAELRFKVLIAAST
jgi:hypothetical protein